MVKVSFAGMMAGSILENTNRIKSMDMENSIGQTPNTIRECGLRVNSMVREYITRLHKILN